MNFIFGSLLFNERDLYLAPICLVALLLFAYTARKKYGNSEIRAYFMPALLLRFLCVVIYTLVLDLYYGFGDTFMYYQATLDMHQAIGDDLSFLPQILLASKSVSTDGLYPYFMFDGGSYTHFYMMNANNFAVPKFALPFSLLFSKSYICISFCLASYAFIGCWRLFKMFYEMYPMLKKKLAIGVLFLPSILFWGSGFLKDSICIGSMGLMLYAIYSIFVRQRKILASILIFVFTAYLLLSIKPYILLSVVAAAGVWILLSLRNRIANRSVRITMGFVMTMIGMVMVIASIQWVMRMEVAAQFSTDNLLKTVQQQQSANLSAEGSTFALGSANGSELDLLLLFPAGLVATYFRPFLWETSNPLMLLSALEALAFLILTIMVFWKVGVRRFFSITFSDPVLLFCLIFSIIFGALIGISTNNFGALVRYKIPCLPCYLFLLFIVMHKSGKFSPDYIFSKRIF